MTKELPDIGRAQRERLFHIDFRAQFLGSVSRAELMERFGIKHAAATRDLALYRSLASGNLKLEHASRRYLRGGGFQPLFTHEPFVALEALAEGLGDDAAVAPAPHVGAERPLRLNAPDPDLTAAVTRAIAQQRVLRIRYRSLASGASEREIAPFGLVDTGVRWHVRARDRARERFADFVLTRIEAVEMADGSPEPSERADEDDQWTRRVTLELVPHPGLEHPATVEMDYAMEGGVRLVRLRAAVVGYALQHFNVDATPDHRLDPRRHHLWLRNAEVLVGVESLAFAPGLGNSD